MTIYLDHNATTPLHERVLEAMLPYMGARSANPSSLHQLGRLQRGAIEQARAQVASLVDARPEQVIFTSGGTEANNLVIKGLGVSNRKNRIAVSAIEHASILEPARFAGDRYKVDTIPVDDEGSVTAENLQQVIQDDTAMVSVMSANNETGVIQDIASLSALTRDQNIWFHTDASQSAGKVAISFKDSGVHAMTLSAHKLYGPMGAGALVIDKRLPLEALLHGGKHENGLRAGTENVPAIVGFGMAAELAQNELEQRSSHTRALRDALQTRLMAFDEVRIFSASRLRLPNTLQFGVHGFDGETLLMQLDRHGIAVSSGSACTSGKAEPSHVLRAMHVPAELATSAVRVSFGKDNTLADVDAFVNAFTQIMAMRNSTLMMAATV